MLDVPQALRDRFAARAYFQMSGSRYHALRLLGIECTRNNCREIGEKVFGTEGCQEFINQNLADANAAKPQIIERLVEQALHGDDNVSSRSTALLARISGWVKEPTVNVDNRRVTLYSMNGGAPTAIGPAEEKPALEGMLDHEPGDAIRVSSDDRIDTLLEGAG